MNKESVDLPVYGELTYEGKKHPVFGRDGVAPPFFYHTSTGLRVYVQPKEVVPPQHPPLAPNASPFKITSMHSTEDAMTNKVFVSPTDFVKLWPYTAGGVISVLAPDGRTHILSIAASPHLSEGLLASSIVHRTQLNVVGSQMVQISPLPAASFSAEVVVQLTLELSVKQGKDFTVDCQSLGVEFFRRHQHQCLYPGRMMLLQQRQTLFGVVVKEMKLKSNPHTLSNSSSLPFTIISADTLQPESIIFVSPDDKLVFENTSLKQLDAQQQQILQAFDLESLGIGGLREEFGKVFQRAFASRALSLSTLKKLGIKHVKGVLLYGPPGTGKTLIARKIGEILHCHEPKIVNGPEVFNKFVGGTEENVRKLFAEAEAEQAAKGELSQLHLIIFDEFDAICKQRGGSRDSTGVNDNVVNQLLAKIDGVNALNNVLLIGMTNRPDLIDDAIKRPGRFEVHVEIGLPNEEGRQEIFRIHTSTMRANGMMSEQVNINYLASSTENYSGAEIEGVVRAATAAALQRHIDLDSKEGVINQEGILVGVQDFERGLIEVKPAFGKASEKCKDLLRGGIVDRGQDWQTLTAKMYRQLDLLCSSQSRVEVLPLLLFGQPGCGKSAVAAHLAQKTAFPYVKVISAEDMVGYGDLQRVNIIRMAFEDAYKSPASCLILDDLERIINFSALGGRYSNDILQALLVLVKRSPPAGRKLCVIGTSTSISTMQEIELDAVFPFRWEIPLVHPNCFGYVAHQLGYSFEDSSLESEVPQLLNFKSIPIKQLPLVLEMSCANESGSTVDKVIRRLPFVNALESSFPA